MTMIPMLLSALALTLAMSYGYAQPAAVRGRTGTGDKPVIIAGTVPDEAARAALLTRLRELYGAARVVDQLEVGGVVPPPNWTQHVTAALTADLVQVRGGELQVNGTQVALRGQVANEAQRQQIASDIATALNPAYTVNNALTVAQDPQRLIDQTLANRVVEFELGAATLTAQGVAVLDKLVAAIATLEAPRIQVVGHTDSSGDRLANIGLSLARAEAVRHYLAGKGIAADRMSALGAGPDRPVASNATAEGRARNRRIEFHILE
jgi:OOP family OmpA-OmpF porin